MKYSGWIDYSSFSIAVIQTDIGYRCQKFVNNTIVRDASQDCSSVNKVKEFLLSFSNPPKEQISILISKLELD